MVIMMSPPLSIRLDDALTTHSSDTAPQRSNLIASSNASVVTLAIGGIAIDSVADTVKTATEDAFRTASMVCFVAEARLTGSTSLTATDAFDIALV